MYQQASEEKKKSQEQVSSYKTQKWKLRHLSTVRHVYNLSGEWMHHFQSPRDEIWEVERRFLLRFTSVATACCLVGFGFLRPIWDFRQPGKNFKDFY